MGACGSAVYDYLLLLLSQYVPVTFLANCCVVGRDLRIAAEIDFQRFHTSNTHLRPVQEDLSSFEPS